MVGGVNQHRIDCTLNRQDEDLPQTILNRISELSCCLLCCAAEGEEHQFTLTPGWDVIVLRYGIPWRIVRRPDIYRFNYVTLKWVDVQAYFKTVDKLLANDANGFPLKIDITYGYQVVDAIRATYSCSHSDYRHFVDEQARSSLVQVASQFPYDSDSRQQRVLRLHNPHIEDSLRRVLQAFVNAVGVRINYFQIRQIQYDESFQHFFLERQRAQAFVIARKSLIDASFGVVAETIKGAERQDRPLSQDEKVHLATRLLLLNCSPSVELKLVNGADLPSVLAGSEEDEK